MVLAVNTSKRRSFTTSLLDVQVPGYVVTTVWVSVTSARSLRLLLPIEALLFIRELKILVRKVTSTGRKFMCLSLYASKGFFQQNIFKLTSFCDEIVKYNLG